MGGTHSKTQHDAPTSTATNTHSCVPGHHQHQSPVSCSKPHTHTLAGLRKVARPDTDAQCRAQRPKPVRHRTAARVTLNLRRKRLTAPALRSTSGQGLYVRSQARVDAAPCRDAPQRRKQNLHLPRQQERCQVAASNRTALCNSYLLHLAHNNK